MQNLPRLERFLAEPQQDRLSVAIQPTVLFLEPDRFPGGIAIWGALSPVYDTTSQRPEKGVHVHARMKVNGPKIIDETYDMVQVSMKAANGNQVDFSINGEDASYYNVGTILKRKVKALRCPSCQCLHTDKETAAIFYHQVHTCESCGLTFQDTEPSISNPVMLLKAMCGDVLQERPQVVNSRRKLKIQQEKFPGGVQIWGSNPAILWTVPRPEDSGIHFHGFCKKRGTPNVDETFGQLSLDGLSLDPEMVRLLMAQQTIPAINKYLSSVECQSCGQAHFDTGEMSMRPHHDHVCAYCGNGIHTVATISNPLLGQLIKLRNKVAGIKEAE